VGEVIAAGPLLGLITKGYPQLPVIVTTNTPTGRDVLRKQWGHSILHAFLPLDYSGPVSRFMDRTQPRCALIFETELWPNLFSHCHRLGVPTVIVNARLSERTMSAPALMRRIYRRGLKNVLAVLARSEADRERFLALGASPEQVTTVGNIKFAHSVDSVVRTAVDPVGRRYWLAASTHQDEELRIARMWKKIADQDCLLVIAPRHPDRREAILRQLESLQLDIAVRSRHEAITAQTQVYLADTLGEMPAFMSHAEFVFLGGSLIEHGGQNILEPARLGKAVIVGPHMDNFAEETRILLVREGIIMVHDEEELQHKISQLRKNSEWREELGKAARKVVAQRSNIAQTYFTCLQDLGVFDD
jgi:3-deoxy-D-manno-octulosonic-acid transferase